jgi:RNA polymerase sigma factor (sigma-70 family)
MSDDTDADLRVLIEQLRLGDESARRKLLDRVYHRLRRIAAAVFQRDFPRLQQNHDLDSVVDESWARLLRALEATPPATVEDFYRMLFHKVRQVLLDMARGQRRHDDRREHGALDGAGSGSSAPFPVWDTTHEPSRLAVWTEFHNAVECLPEVQRKVFDFHYFAEFSQADIARLLDMPPKQVSRLWLAATGQLAQWLENSGGTI